MRRKTRNVYGMDVMTDMKELSPIVGDIAKTESIPCAPWREGSAT